MAEKGLKFMQEMITLSQTQERDSEGTIHAASFILASRRFYLYLFVIGIEKSYKVRRGNKTSDTTCHTDIQAVSE